MPLQLRAKSKIIWQWCQNPNPACTPPSKATIHFEWNKKSWSSRTKSAASNSVVVFVAVLVFGLFVVVVLGGIGFYVMLSNVW